MIYLCLLPTNSKINKKMASHGLHLLIFGLIAYHANAVMFHVEPNMQKCLRDQVQAHQLVVMEFEVTDVPGQQIDYVVRINETEFNGHGID